MKHATHTTALLLFLALAANARTALRPAGGCDTLTTVEGKIYLVSSVEEHGQEVHFSTCDDPSRVYAMPKGRVASIKKAKIPKAEVPTPTPPKPVAVPKPKRPPPAPLTP